MQPLPKRYLTDGVFVQSGSYVGEFILTTEDGVNVTNKIHLDPLAIKEFNRFVDDTKKHAAAEIEKAHAGDAQDPDAEPEQKCPRCGSTNGQYRGDRFGCGDCGFGLSGAGA